MRPSPSRMHTLLTLLALMLALAALAITPSQAFMSGSTVSSSSTIAPVGASSRAALPHQEHRASVSKTSSNPAQITPAAAANFFFAGRTSPLLANLATATVSTDKADYAPGETVTITGTGWQPGETVTLLLHELPQTHADVTLTAVADGSGNITNTDFVVDNHDQGKAFVLLATGQASGQTAYTTFTDLILINSVKLNGVTLGFIAPPSITVGPGASITVEVTVTTSLILNDWRSTNYSIASLADIFGFFVNHRESLQYLVLLGGKSPASVQVQP